MTALVLLLLAAGPDLATQVKARLDPAPVQQGTFEQKKQVKGFKRPLASSGVYVVTRGAGVQWSTQKPFASELKVTAGEIASTQNGAEVFRLDARQEPAVRVITQVLFSLLAGDLAALDQHFTAKGTVGERDWAIELKPKAAALEKIFTVISLQGDRAVRRVELREASGDVTDITLTPAPRGGEAGP